MSESRQVSGLLLRRFTKVSIVVATYRRKESLNRALQSLISQSYSEIEIIVVDDNANAEWNAIVRTIIKKLQVIRKINIKHIINAKNSGSAESRNIGIAAASGEYITFLDDDDIYLPDKVKKQLLHMQNKGSDYSITDLWLYDENENLIEKRTRGYIDDESTESLIRYHMMYHITGTDVMMFKKKYLTEIGMFSLIDVGDEFYLMQKAIENDGLFSYIPICEVKAYVHSETDGLSSGESKIAGENKLFEYKKKYFSVLSKSDRNYIKMRHYAVLAYAEMRRKKFLHMGFYILLSLASSPGELIQLYSNRVK